MQENILRSKDENIWVLHIIPVHTTLISVPNFSVNNK
jgi:hypothetical protein